MIATIKDVADRAGCSIASVSRHVNGTAPISIETRERIEAAIAELGYRPSEMGRSLRRQTSRTIGVIVPSLTNPVFAASVSGLQAKASAAGFGVLVASTEYNANEELRAVEIFLGQRVDGIALTVSDALSSPALSVLEAEQKPHVLLYNAADKSGRIAVSVDSIAAARAMTEAILSAGHRQIAFLAGRFAASDRSRLRYRGFCDALAVAGIAPQQPIEVDFLSDMPDDAIEPIFKSKQPPTALFCSNDLLALATIGALRRLGLSVPRDVSVAGFDGIALGRMVEPPLATVSQPSRQLGENAMQLLLDLIAGVEVQDQPAHPFILHLGGTLASVSTRDFGHHSMSHSYQKRFLQNGENT